MTDKTISEKCETLYNKLNSFVTSVINRDVTPKINNLESGKADIVHTHFTRGLIESSALHNIGTRANAIQSVVNEAVDEKIGSLSTSITNIGSWSTANFGKATVYYNDYFVYVSITQNSNTNTVPTTYNLNIGSTYAPPSPVNVPSYTMYNGNPYAFARINTNGAIEIIINRSTYTSSGGVTLIFGVLYPRI